MQKSYTKYNFNDGWCFAYINGRLGEIYFDKKYGIYAHCYIDKDEFNKKEQKIIESDTRKYKFTYRNGFYFDKLNNIKHKSHSLEEIFPDLKSLR